MKGNGTPKMLVFGIQVGGNLSLEDLQKMCVFFCLKDMLTCFLVKLLGK